MESYVPPDTTVLAGADLNRVRAWAPDTFRDASRLLVAFNGKNLLFIAHGKDISLSGAPDTVRAATEHPNPACELCERAPHRDVWVVVRGGGPLPLSGNAANFNRLLRLTDWLTAGATAGDRFDIEIQAHCRSEDAARQFEETSRAAITLAGSNFDVARDGVTVRVSGSVSPDVITKLLR